MVDLHTIGDNACHNVSFPLRLLPILKFGCGGRDRRGRGRRRDHMMRDVRTCHPLSLSRFAAPRPPDEERSKAERAAFWKAPHAHARARSLTRSVAATEPKEEEGEPADRRPDAVPERGRASIAGARQPALPARVGGGGGPLLSTGISRVCYSPRADADDRRVFVESE